ncbi:putative magnesium transporter NIPA8 [Hibiscus syriacus]|uniref:Probable magnesium transporter n=1 Tax=Hibiscus syriacus TaxID=106335 RepID=A0A6A3A882_HIBSY|nr:putative magnesium transporter NIPA8 [Hibiscus syriacus]
MSLLAALGSVQFVSNIAFAYFVLNKMDTVKVLAATAFIVLGNFFLVAFGNHQSPVYTPGQLAEKYSNITFLIYCLILILVVAFHHYIYRRGEMLLVFSVQELRPYWNMLLPFSYAVVSGAVGSCSVLFAKSLSNLLRLTMSTGYQLHSWFTYSVILLFLSTAGFWVFDGLRTTMFILGMISVFIGISLLAPDEPRGGEVKDNSHLNSNLSSSTETDMFILASEDADRGVHSTTCALSLGFGEDSINASAVLVMPMMSSKITGFRGNGFDRSRILSMSNSSWSRVAVDEESVKILNGDGVLPQSPRQGQQ